MNLKFIEKIQIVLFVSLLLLAYLLSGVGGENYTDSNGRYTMEFPQGWERSDVSGVDVAYMHPQNDEFRENINILSVSGGGVKNTKEFVTDAANEVISELKKQFPGTTVYSGVKAEKILDHWSAAYVLDVKYDFGTLRQSQTIIASQGYSAVFTITCTATPSTFSSYESQFSQSVNSFQILNEPESKDSFLEGFIIATIAGALIGGVVAALVGFLIMKKKKKQAPAVVEPYQMTGSSNLDSRQNYQKPPPISPPRQPPFPP